MRKEITALLKLRARRRDDRGAVAIMVAVMATMLFVIAALVVDLGFARDVKGQSQHAADASALAAANVLYPASGKCQMPLGDPSPCFDDAVLAAKSYASENFDVPATAWGACTDPSPLDDPHSSTPCISFDNEATKVRVLVPTRDVATGFGVIAGVQTIPISSSARAVVAGGPQRSCGLCVLGNVSTNNTDFTVSPGSILVNGDIQAANNSVWTAGGDILVGGASVSTKAAFVPAWSETTPIEDPFAALAMPSAVGTAKAQPCATKPKKGPEVPGDGPGVYGTVSISGDCQLSTGIYVITGKWTLGNKDILSGVGITLYVTASGELDFKNGYAEFSAMTSGLTSGLAIVYDRNNTNEIGLQGNGSTNITGAIYAKNASINLNGSSCFTVQNGPIIVSGISAVGNKSCIKVTNSADAQLAAIPGDIGLDQ